MVNLQERVLQFPDYCRQFTCGSSLITMFSCPIESRLSNDRFASIWTENNYIFYVLGGKKTWHTPNGIFEIKEGDCVFVRKGGSILEQFNELGFCVVLFFIPDEFLCETLKAKSKPLVSGEKKFSPVIRLQATETLKRFFLSMHAYFNDTNEPDQSLIELKFKELILMIAGNTYNAEMLAYFCSLLQEPQQVSLQRIMEDNFSYNLKMEQYAALCNRSLSAFKRDFKKHFNNTPGKWLLEKRLQYASTLMGTLNKTVNEAAFESGFENVSHFSRSFKERFGHSPKAVKNSVAVNN